MKKHDYSWSFLNGDVNQRYGYGMILVVLVLFTILGLFCIMVAKNEYLERNIMNVKTSVVAINGNSAGLDYSKPPVPEMYTVVLFKVESGKYKGKYFEASSRDYSALRRGWVYNHIVGDSMLFPSMDTANLFEINKR